MGRILSGVQPTGNLHLGNYLGAIRHWKALQQDNECLFMIADLHSITVKYSPEDLRQSVLSVAALYFACGISPQRSAVFCQSRIAAHSELAWILGCNAPLGWLDRMTQFKEKAGKNKARASLGLYSYPVLMAADILLYNADTVPVGDDQKQHLELTRDIAAAFNRNYSKEVFKIPEPFIGDSATRVMSLRDGKSKMSKSDPSAYSRINLLDSDEDIQNKIRLAKSDMDSTVSYSSDRHELANLIQIYAALIGKPLHAVARKVHGLHITSFKSLLIEAAIETIQPIRDEYRRLLREPDVLLSFLAAGAERAATIASETMREVKSAVGLV